MTIFTRYTKLHIDLLDDENNIQYLAHSQVLAVTDTTLIIEMPTCFQYQVPVALNKTDFASFLIKFESSSKIANSFIVKTYEYVEHDAQTAICIARPKNSDMVKFNRRKGTRINIDGLFVDIQNAQTSRKEKVEVFDVCSKGLLSVKASKSFLYTLRLNMNSAAGQHGLINVDGTFLYGQAKTTLTEDGSPETNLIPVKSFKIIRQFDSDKHVSLLLELNISTYEKNLLETFICEALTTQLLNDTIPTN